MVANKMSIKQLKKSKKREETEIVSQIKQYLDIRGIYYERNNTGFALYDNTDGTKRGVAYNIPGKSDLTVLIKGLYIAVEVKTPKEYEGLMKHRNSILSGKKKGATAKRVLNQMLYIDKIIKIGHAGFFTFSLQDFITKFEFLKNKRSEDHKIELIKEGICKGGINQAPKTPPPPPPLRYKIGGNLGPLLKK